MLALAFLCPQFAVAVGVRRGIRAFVIAAFGVQSRDAGSCGGSFILRIVSFYQYPMIPLLRKLS